MDAHGRVVVNWVVSETIYLIVSVVFGMSSSAFRSYSFWGSLPWHFRSWVRSRPAMASCGSIPSRFRSFNRAHPRRRKIVARRTPPGYALWQRGSTKRRWLSVAFVATGSLAKPGADHERRRFATHIFGLDRRHHWTGCGRCGPGRKACAAATALGANDRVQMAVIGCGGMGTGHLNGLVQRAAADNVHVVGVCDVYQRRLSRAKDIAKSDGYADYRKLLERKDLDAVLIATPDHWHSKIAIDAMESGKHVYVEKPMTHTVEQAIELRNGVKRTARSCEVGPRPPATTATGRLTTRSRRAGSAR